MYHVMREGFLFGHLFACIVGTCSSVYKYASHLFTTERLLSKINTDALLFGLGVAGLGAEITSIGCESSYRCVPLEVSLSNDDDFIL